MLIYPLFVGTPNGGGPQGFVVCDAPSCLSLPKQHKNDRRRCSYSLHVPSNVGRYRLFLCPVSRLASSSTGRDLPYSDSLGCCADSSSLATSELVLVVRSSSCGVPRPTVFPHHLVVFQYHLHQYCMAYHTGMEN